ncbi:hypothetical protein BDW22DRAFT_1353767 [Trametopsis cervina]|nr:hypothetical protein BDW22DRAFT_1353767 [Trametopsis cervina]
MRGQTNSSADVQQTRRGKQPKTFVDSKNAALDIASSVAGTVEEKSKKRIAQKRQATQKQTSPKSDSKFRPSSKDKLREVKATLKIERARAKRSKTKAQKNGGKCGAISPPLDASKGLERDAELPRKRVSFA